MKIAVIGAGLAGLSAAWLLGRSHQVTLFERQARPGFTAASVTVPGPEGQGLRVDVPLRVFYPGYYPTLGRLYRALGVASEPVSYAASFCGADGQLYFRYRNLQFGARSWAVLAPRDLLSGRRAWRIVGGLLQFHRRVAAAGPSGHLAAGSIGDYVRAQRCPQEFVDGFLLPTIATVCTCTCRQALDFPAAVILGYLAQGVARQSVRRALHGADDVQQRLLAGVADWRCDARIHAVHHEASGLLLRMVDGSTQRFDHVVMATQANQALALLAEARTDEVAMLSAFRYTPVEVVTHTDPTLMPARRRDWSPVNLRVAPDHEAPAATIWVNAVQPALRGAPDVFQTVHPQRQPRANTVIGQARFERPLVDAGSASALARLQGLHQEPDRRLWFCGAYAQAGIPLLESAVRSSYDVAWRIDPRLPDAGSAFGGD